METKKRFNTLFRRFVVVGAAALILAAGVSPIAAAPQQEDPIKVIQKHGTAGMKLAGGKQVIVIDNKLFVKSGQRTRPLLPDRAQLVVRSNASELGSRDIQRLAMDAVKSKLGQQYNQSYKIHSDFKLKGKQGNLRTVVCDLVFEYKNIWYAETHTLELDIASNGNVHTLKQVRTPMALVKPTMKPRMAKKKVEPRPIAPRPGKPTAAKKKDYRLKTEYTEKALKKYKNWASLPVYRLLTEFRIKPIYLIPTAKGLANTAYPSVVTADEATQQVHVLMQFALGTASKLIGPTQSSKNNVLNYLKNDSNLVAWNNIGHGGPTVLCQNGTNIYDTDIWPSTSTFAGLSGCVCLINSCQTFHDPLKAAILHHSPRVYIAGVLNLPMVTSEGSNPVFWFKTLFQHKPMSVAYNETNTESGLTGYWGYWGYTGPF